MKEALDASRAAFSPPRLFISYSRGDGRAFAEDFEQRIAAVGLTSWRDLTSVEGGEDIRPQVLLAIGKAEHLVLILTGRALASDWVRLEWMHARAHGVKVSPVLADPTLRRDELPAWARRADIYDIAEPERFTKLIEVLKGPGSTRRVPYMTGHLPESFVQRPAQFNRLKELVLTAPGGAVGLTTALVGAGGYGKTTLANFLCRDEEIRFEFSDGIVRVEIGKERTSVLGLIVDLIETLDPDGDRPGFQDEKVAGEHLAQVLGKARLLLVIDDVWRESQLRPFLLGGPNCVRLVTTRRPNVLPPSSGTVDVDELTPAEAYSVLTWELPEAGSSVAHRITVLARRLKGWTQMLEIANAWLRERVRLGEGLEAAVADFEERLDRRGLAAFDPSDARERSQAISLSVDASLEDLATDDRTRYEELAILPEDEDSPVSIVAGLWARTGQLNASDTEDLLLRLRRLSLLQTLDLGAHTVRLHDNMKWLLRDRMGAERLAAAHGAMADTLWASGGGSWANLPSNELYGWRHGLGHLRAAGRGTEADALLTDYAWIRAKLSVGGAQSLFAAWQPAPQDEEARTVGRAVALSVPALSRRPEQLALQLWGRLGNLATPRIVALTEAARHDATFSPMPRWPALTPPGRELLRLVGHEAPVSSVVFSPNGARLATVSQDGMARLWDVPTGAEITAWQGDLGWYAYAVFSPDGARLATAGYDDTVRLRDVATDLETIVLLGHRRVHCVAFSPDGARVATSGKGTRIWDAATGVEIAVLQSEEIDVVSVTFSPDGTRLATLDDRVARLWDVATGAEAAVLRGHIRHVTSLAFSPDGTCVATASEDGTARLWDCATGEQTAVLRHDEMAMNVVFSPDGRRVATACRDHTVLLWDVATEAEAAVLRGHKGMVESLVFSPDGTCVATASHDGTARLWDVTTGEQTAVLRGHEDRVTSVAFAPDGARLATGSADHTARLWDAPARAETPFLHGHDRTVTGVAFSPDGGRVATASEDGTARLWEAATGAEIAVLRGHEDTVRGVWFLSDGQRVATASADDTARLWEAATGVETTVMRGHKGAVTSVVLFSEANRVVTASKDRTARLWDAATGAQIDALRMFDRRAVTGVALSPDGRRVATACRDCTVLLWDVATEAEAAVLRGHKGIVQSLGFSPDGVQLVTASEDGTVRLWDAASGRETTVMHCHTGMVTSVALSPDGARVAIAILNNHVELWDVATGAETAILPGSLPSVAFSSDGARVLTRSRDGTARLWDAATGAETACIVMDAAVTAIAAHGTCLAVGDALGRVCVYDFVPRTPEITSDV